MATVDAHGYDFIQAFIVSFFIIVYVYIAHTDYEISVLIYKVQVLSYRRGGLRLLVLTVMGNSYGLRLWSE